MKTVLNIAIIAITFLPMDVSAYSVSALKATYKNGQVFLTWKNPDVLNLKYKVYRSATKITSDTQLTNSAYLGYVRDSSGMNIRKSRLKGQVFYFTIDPASGPLHAKYGLYVVTCDKKKKYFYAVTVVDLSANAEDKAINMGKNSLKSGVKEKKESPQPILQNTVAESNGDINYEYAIWGNNQDVTNYSAFNNCGSYGYNYTLVSRNPGNSAPLFIKFQDDDPFAQADSECANCNILLLDDWIPNGDNTFWIGFNTNYDMYSTSNPVQTSGQVRTYTQYRVHKIIQWAASQPTVDSTRVYTSGFSHNGYGALLTSVLLPNAIAATQETSAPIAMIAYPGSDRETQWCSYYDGDIIKSDIVDLNSGDTLPIWHVLDLSTMFNHDINHTFPFISGVNGKQDITVGWVQSLHWYDSVNLNRQGGIWFWDQRIHNGNGKNFSPDQTHLDFLRFSTHKSYPAFSYCSINQNPGNGDPNNGDPFGAINGYLDWDDSSIIDHKCNYSVNCFIKDFYVGSMLQPQYDSCTTDITLRRLQKFKPANGNIISWDVKNSTDLIVQQGSFTFNDAAPITIQGAKIYRSGSTISFSINNCTKEESATTIATRIKMIRIDNGYEVTLDLPASVNSLVSVTDLLGRTLSSRIIAMQEGSNTFFVPLNNRGIYFLNVKAAAFSVSQKIIF